MDIRNSSGQASVQGIVAAKDFHILALDEVANLELGISHFIPGAFASRLCGMTLLSFVVNFDHRIVHKPQTYAASRW